MTKRNFEMENKVLIVEDDSATAELESRALKRSGFDVIVADTLESAIRHIQESCLSAVVLDFSLGSEKSWPVLEASNGSLPAIPVIMVTATGDERIASEAMQKGATDYVIKTGNYIHRLTQSAENATRAARAERSLKLMKAWQSTILGSVDAHMILVDKAGSIVLANNSWKEFVSSTGVSFYSDPTGRSYNDVLRMIDGVSTAYRNSAEEGMQRVLDGELPRFTTEYKWELRNNVRWYRLEISPTHHDPGIGAVIMHVDITDRVEAEAVRLENAELLQRVLQSVNEGILVADADGALIKWNATAEQILGISFEDHREDWQQWLRPIPVDDGSVGELAEFPLLQALEGESVTDRELRVADEDGLPLYINIAARPLRDPSGGIRGAVATFRDTTERIARETELRKISAAVKQTADAIIISDTNGCVEFVNPAFEKMYGYTAREVAGKSVEILRHSAQDPSAYDDLWDKLRAGHTWSGRLVNQSKSGERRVADITINPVRDNVGNTRSYVASLRDVTDQEAMEAQLRQSQKMEAVGVLAGGIAHDFNNLLAAIDGYSRMAANKLSESSQEHDDLSQVLRATERAKGLIRQILTFSRQAESTMRPISLEIVVNESVGLMRATLPSSIVLKTDIASENGAVMGDATQLQQVIINLGTNAAHAMSNDGGVLSIDLRSATKKQVEKQLSLTPGEYVCLSIQDTGCGIPPELLSKIFDPFFSTKDTNRGTGLGLSTVMGIVKDHRGCIEVNSELGQGATFRVYLPVRPDTKPVSAERRQKKIIRGNGEHVLVVDDEDSIARLSGRMLEGLGYKTSVFTDPEEALKAFKESPGNYHLVLSDLTMPRLTGDRLAEAIAETAPETPVIILSGFSESKLLDESNAAAILTKPVSIATLSNTIYHVLYGEGGYERRRTR